MHKEEIRSTIAAHSSAVRSALDKARQLCAGCGAELLYLTLFGSTLYGTERPGASDIDVRGIFLPSLSSLAMGEAPHSLHFSTGESDSRNSAEDLDIDLWSLQHWLLKLLPGGDTGAQDLLFSPSHEACTLMHDSRLDEVFTNPLRFLDLSSSEACARYCLGQAKKYGIKGSRLGALKAMLRKARELCPAPEGRRLGEYIARLAEHSLDDSFCRIAQKDGEEMLLLCCKFHPSNIKMQEFFRRLEADMARFGHRALEAEKNQGIDWKALSHGLRAIFQREELLAEGGLHFPLARRAELLAVKLGQRPWADIERDITEGLERLSRLQADSPFGAPLEEGSAAREARRVILHCYGLEENHDC